MKSTLQNAVLLSLSFNTASAASSENSASDLPHLQLPPQAIGMLSTLKSPAHRHLHRRQSQSTSAPDSNSWYTMTTAEAGDSNCLFAVLGVDGSVPYPVKFESCNPLKDDSLWQFVPDSNGRYFIYNKAWAGTGQRLDINCQTPSLCIEWMGPSGDIYNNQRRFLEGSSGTFRITSLGLPGSTLISTKLDSGYVSLMQNTTTTAIDDSAQNWKLVESSSVSASVGPTVLVTSATTAISTPAASSTSTTATASYSSSSITTTNTQSTNFASTSSGASTFGTTIISTSPSASAPGPSSSPTNSTSQPGGQNQNGLSAGDKAGIASACIAGVGLLIVLFALPASLVRLLTCGRYPRENINNSQLRANMRNSIRRVIAAEAHDMLAR